MTRLRFTLDCWIEAEVPDEAVDEIKAEARNLRPVGGGELTGTLRLLASGELLHEQYMPDLSGSQVDAIMEYMRARMNEHKV